jgi:hypothetical protein
MLPHKHLHSHTHTKPNTHIQTHSITCTHTHTSQAAAAASSAAAGVAAKAAAARPPDVEAAEDASRVCQTGFVNKCMCIKMCVPLKLLLKLRSYACECV